MNEKKMGDPFKDVGLADKLLEGSQPKRVNKAEDREREKVDMDEDVQLEDVIA
jgi:hypothetical protein